MCRNGQAKGAVTKHGAIEFAKYYPPWPVSS